MNVLGLNERGDYICTVSHSELEKVADKYYGKIEKRLKAGDSFDLGTGYDYRSDIKRACTDMANAEKSFGQAKGTLHKFAVMVASLPAPPETESA